MSNLLYSHNNLRIYDAASPDILSKGCNADLVIRSGCIIGNDDRPDCPPDQPCCSGCLMWNTPTQRCLFWDDFDTNYQVSTLIPYLRTHNPKFFI